MSNEKTIVVGDYTTPLYTDYKGDMASFWGPWAIAWGLTKIPSSQRIPLASTTSRQVDGFVCCFVVVAESLVEGHGQRDAYLGIKPWGRANKHVGSFFLLLLWVVVFELIHFCSRMNAQKFQHVLLRLLRDVESILWYMIHPSAFLFYTVCRNIGSHVAALVLEILPRFFP